MGSSKKNIFSKIVLTVFILVILGLEVSSRLVNSEDIHPRRQLSSVPTEALDFSSLRFNEIDDAVTSLRQACEGMSGKKLPWDLFWNWDVSQAHERMKNRDTFLMRAKLDAYRAIDPEYEGGAEMLVSSLYRINQAESVARRAKPLSREGVELFGHLLAYACVLRDFHEIHATWKSFLVAARQLPAFSTVTRY